MCAFPASNAPLGQRCIMVGIVTVGALLVHGWQNVGSWLAECWFMVGGLMLGQRVSNEQSNVGPTKYDAVGPTLNQRLGFGWQMVDVLAGLWVNYRKTAFQQFKVAYNNSYRILNRLPMRCSASNMFALFFCACVLRKSIYSLMTRIHASLNPIVNSIARGDVYCTSALRIQWVSQLYNM